MSGEGARLEVYVRKGDGLYDWRKRAGNNQTVATSGGQGFTERNDAQEAASREFPGLPVVHLNGVEDE